MARAPRETIAIPARATRAFAVPSSPSAPEWLSAMWFAGEPTVCNAVSTWSRPRPWIHVVTFAPRAPAPASAHPGRLNAQWAVSRRAPLADSGEHRQRVQSARAAKPEPAYVPVLKPFAAALVLMSPQTPTTAPPAGTYARSRRHTPPRVATPGSARSRACLATNTTLARPAVSSRVCARRVVPPNPAVARSAATDGMARAEPGVKGRRNQ